MKAPRLELLLVAGWLAGCAGPHVGPEAPMAPGEPRPTTLSESAFDRTTEPRTLEQAEAALEHARAELSKITLAESPVVSGGAPPPPPAAAPAAPERSDAAPKEERALEEGAEGEKSAPDPCATACRAFGSLLRAKDAVCRLEEPRGARCTRAEDVVRDAEARVRSCACSP